MILLLWDSVMSFGNVRFHRIFPYIPTIVQQTQESCDISPMRIDISVFWGRICLFFVVRQLNIY